MANSSLNMTPVRIRDAKGVQPEHSKDVAAFLNLVRARLEKGWEEYGDKSFQRDPKELLNEIKEELADVCGWAGILYARICELERKS